MRRGSLCSGIEGLGLLLPGEPVWHAEIEPGPVALLERRFPGVPNLGDLMAVEWSAVEPVDLLIAGPPCQPSSVAGKRLGPADDRWLWDEVWRAVRVLRPGLVLLENPLGIFGWLDLVLGGLAEVGGYETRWIVLSAAAVGAPHRRERWFCLAVAADQRRRGVQRWGEPRSVARSESHAKSTGDQREWDGYAVGDGHQTSADCSSIGLDGAGSTWRRRSGSEDRRRTTPDGDGEGLERRLARGERSSAPERASRLDEGFDWGPYRPAIRRWERVMGRPAPAGVDGRGRLNVAYDEWHMGFPQGWVDGMGRTAAISALGNAVVPLQAKVAWDLLIGELS